MQGSPRERQLRPYQAEAVDRIRQSLLAGHKRPLLVVGTGGGKSSIFAKIISLACEKGKKCLFIVHRRNLVKQFQETLREHFFIESGVIMAGEEFVPGLDVYCTTIQTYSRRLNLDSLDRNRFFIDADIVQVDEAHCSVSSSYMKVINLYKDKVIIGCTATPIRADGRGLGAVYDDLIDVAGTARLIKEGYLSPVRYYVPSEVDLAKIKIQMGDYSKKELAERVDRPKIVGDIVESWLKYAEGRKTIAFAVNVAHSIHLAEEFNRVGISAIHLDARSSDEERDRAFESMEKGYVKVICNNLLYVEGIDVPDVGCVVMARPTKSIGLYRQAIGRGLRVSDGKKDLIVLDHGGCVAEHGLVEDEVEWCLDDAVKGWKKKKRTVEKKLSTCRACKFVFEGSDTCPLCGTKIKKFARAVQSTDGELMAIGKKKDYSMVDKRRYYGMMLWYVREKKWKDGAAACRYKDKFGVWPRLGRVMPIKPDDEFLAYQKHLTIKYLKSKKHAV